MHERQMKCGMSAATCRMRCAVVTVVLCGLTSVALADTYAVPISLDVQLRAYAHWEEWGFGYSATDEDFGQVSATASATWEGYTGATSYLNAANQYSQVAINTDQWGYGGGTQACHTIAEVQSGTITIGTSTEYPTGTPLLLVLSAYSEESYNGANSNYMNFQISRGSYAVLDEYASYHLSPTEWTTVVYAGETLTPWIRHDFATDEEGVRSKLHVTMRTIVPEPTTLALLLLGALAWRRR